MEQLAIYGVGLVSYEKDPAAVMGISQPSIHECVPRGVTLLNIRVHAGLMMCSVTYPETISS